MDNSGTTSSVNELSRFSKILTKDPTVPGCIQNTNGTWAESSSKYTTLHSLLGMERSKFGGTSVCVNLFLELADEDNIEYVVKDIRGEDNIACCFFY